MQSTLWAEHRAGTEVGFRHIYTDCTRLYSHLGDQKESQPRERLWMAAVFLLARSWQGPTTPGRKVTGVRDKNSHCCYSWHSPIATAACLNNSSEQGRGMERGGEGWEEGRSLPCLLGLPRVVPEVSPWLHLPPAFWRLGVKRQDKLTGTFSTSYPLKKTRN